MGEKKGLKGFFGQLKPKKKECCCNVVIEEVKEELNKSEEKNKTK